MKLSFEPIRPEEDGGTGHRWYAALDEDSGTPAFDGSGVTLMEALIELVSELGRWYEEHSS